MTTVNPQPRPYRDNSDALLLQTIAALKYNIAEAQRRLYEAETEALVRMTDNNATSIPSETFLCEAVADISYNRAGFAPLKEIFNELDLASCWTPATQVLQVVAESWNTAKTKAMARKYGDAALAVVERARVEGRPRLKLERRRDGHPS